MKPAERPRIFVAKMAYPGHLLQLEEEVWRCWMHPNLNGLRNWQKIILTEGLIIIMAASVRKAYPGTENGYSGFIV